MRVDGKYAGELYDELRRLVDEIEGVSLDPAWIEDDLVSLRLRVHENARALLVRIEASATPSTESQSHG
jgi:hypothetical protein